MKHVFSVTLSASGRVVIPDEIRTRLGLTVGTQFVVIGNEDVVILKVLQPPANADFAVQVRQARQAAKQSGMGRKDPTRAVATVRRASRQR
jgi:AbrB family looped-hinge helix DNA binding protein